MIRYPKQISRISHSSEVKIPHFNVIIPLSFHFSFKYLRYNTIIETNTTIPMKGSIIMKKTYIRSA